MSSPEIEPTIGGTVRKIDIFKPPHKDTTGVELYVTRVCATVCGTLYKSDPIPSDFEFNTKDGRRVECVLYDDHGDFKATNPPFVVVVIEDTMILAWRGTNTLGDAISDATIAPIDLSRWGRASSGIKAHGGFCSLVQSDLEQLHGGRLVGLVEKKGIGRLVFTGHSLGGGLAQTAHLFIQSKLLEGSSDSANGDKVSKWSDCADKLTCRTVAFSAPMSVLDVAEVPSSGAEEAKKFLDRVSETSCNIVYGADIVPRGYGNVKFLEDAIGSMNKVGLPTMINKGLKIEDKVTRLDEGYITVCKKFRHVGDIVYYHPFFHKAWTPHDPALGPVQPMKIKANDDPKFATYKGNDEQYVKRLQLTPDMFYMAHLFFPMALAYGLSQENIGKRHLLYCQKHPVDLADHNHKDWTDND